MSKTQSFSEFIHQVGIIDSTMTAAAELAKNGAAHGMTVLAEGQLAGRGRRGKNWFAPRDGGVWMTTILRPESANGENETPPIQQISLVAGASLLSCLSEHVGDNLGLKWPNDVVHRESERKVAGILVEALGLGDASPVVLVGIGVNLKAAAALDLPADITDRYIGLAEIGKSDSTQNAADVLEPAMIAKEIVDRLSEDYEDWRQNGLARTHEVWRKADILRGRLVEIDADPVAAAGDATGTGNGCGNVSVAGFVGVALGLAPDGELRLADLDGAEGDQLVQSGEVRALD